MRHSPHRPDPQPDPRRDEVIDLGAIAALLWRGKWLIAGIAAAAAFAVLVYVLLVATPMFRAAVTLVLDTREETVANVESVVGVLRADTAVINSEVEALRSRALFGQVVDSMNLTADPEFNAALTPPGPVAAALQATAATLRGLLGATDPPSVPSEAQVRERAISALAENVSVMNIPLSLVFEVAVETTDPGKSARIANAISDLYIRDQVARKYAATENATTLLAERVVELEAAFMAADQAMRDFQASAEVGDETQIALAEEQMAALDLRLADQRTTAASAEANLAALRAAGDDLPRLAEVAADQRLRTLLAEGAAGPAQDRAAQILRAAEQDSARAAQQLAALTASRTSLQAEIARMSEVVARSSQLTREAESARLIYENFLNRLQETAVQEGLQRADSRLLSAAVPPDRPSSPQTRRLLAIALVLGALAGIGLTVLREMRARGFRTADVLEARTGLAVLGQVPLIRARGMPGKLAWLAQHPNAAAAEAIRNLRTSCLLADLRGPRRPVKVIAVTSALPEEGKSTLSLGLAQSFAAMGRSVVLVDGDLRNRSISVALRPPPTAGGTPAPGLVAALRGTLAATPAADAMPETTARVLTSETSAPDAADLLAGPAFAALLAELRAAHDIVIVDTPPLLPVPDARLVAQNADLILFAVRWNVTTDRQVRDGLRLLPEAQRAAAGLVLTRIDPRKLRALGEDYGPQMARYYAE